MSAPFDTGIRPEDVVAEHPKFVETPFGALALHKVGGEILAAQAFCPHLDGPLYEGTIVGEHIVCPWHFWRFDLRTGKRVLLGLLSRAPRLPCELGTGIVVCDVSTSERGTIVLANARRG